MKRMKSGLGLEVPSGLNLAAFMFGVFLIEQLSNIVLKGLLAIARTSVAGKPTAHWPNLELLTRQYLRVVRSDALE
jgi:hypothetical protein